MPSTLSPQVELEDVECIKPTVQGAAPERYIAQRRTRGDFRMGRDRTRRGTKGRTRFGDAIHLRRIVVPFDIVAVPRRSPPRARKRTPWHPRPDGATTLRSGGRDWFSDRLFVEGEKPHARFSFGTSFALHACAGLVLSVALWTRIDPVVLPRKPPVRVMSVSLTMPFEDRARHQPQRRLRARLRLLNESRKQRFPRLQRRSPTNRRRRLYRLRRVSRRSRLREVGACSASATASRVAQSAEFQAVSQAGPWLSRLHRTTRHSKSGAM